MYYFKVPSRESSRLSTTQHEHADLRINAQTIVALLGPVSTLEKFSPLSALKSCSGNSAINYLETAFANWHLSTFENHKLPEPKTHCEKVYSQTISGEYSGA